MTQRGPNPVELYEAALQAMLPVLRGIQPGQLSSATPCTEWNVQQLINHNLKVADFFVGIVQGNVTVNPMDVSGALPPEGAEAAFSAGTSQLLELFKAERDLSRVIEAPHGTMPVGHLILLPFGDVLIHKWDLAKATGQDTYLDSSMAEACFNAWAQGMEGFRDQGFFGTEVNVPLSASMGDKLLALTGRQP